jgi:hypothetical protein
MPLADTLLRLAAADLFQPVWSSLILDEVERTMIEKGIDRSRAQRRTSLMNAALPGAMTNVSRNALALVPPKVDEGDRHVVAAAISSSSGVIVTENIRHFARAELIKLGLDVLTPDEFLVAIIGASPDEVMVALSEQAGALQKPPRTLAELINAYKNVPNFARMARARLLV